MKKVPQLTHEQPWFLIKKTFRQGYLKLIQLILISIFGIQQFFLHPTKYYRQLEDQQVAPPTIFISGTKSPITNVFVLLTPFLDQTNTIIPHFFALTQIT